MQVLFNGEATTLVLAVAAAENQNAARGSDELYCIDSFFSQNPTNSVEILSLCRLVLSH